MRKVLFVAESLSVGGAEKALVSILKTIDYSKLDVTLMLISKSGNFIEDADRTEKLKIRYIVEPSSSPIISFLNSLKIRAIYKWLPAKVVGNFICRDYDVVIAFCEGYLTKWVAASTVNCKKIAWVHTDMVNNDWPVRTGVFLDFEAEREAYFRFNQVVGVSNIVSEGMKSKFGLKKVYTIYNLLDNSIEAKSKVAVGYRPNRRLNLVSVGRLENIKGYNNLIEAVKILVNEKKFDISLCLVGDGSQRSTLESKVKSFNLSDRIIFVGIQQNPYPYIKSSDIYVCSSIQEGFNIAILEAMTLGKPIIATDSAGPREILDGDTYGLLVENSVAGLIYGITNFYNNDYLIEHYIKQAELRTKHFNSGVQLHKITDLVLSV